MISSARNLDDILPALRFPDGPLSLVRRWREVAAALPEVLAAVDPGAPGRLPTRYTFAEADRLSDLIALAIVERTGDSELPVAALLGHDADAVVALMALLKTGRIRVVLDTHLPAERLRQVAAIAGSKVAVVDDRHDALAQGLGLDSILSLDTLLADALRSEVTSDELATRVAHELAAGESRQGTDPFEIVFTSGSTGVPKGVVQRHGSFLNEVAGFKPIRGFRAGDPIAAVLPLSFLAGSGTLVSILLGGSTAFLIDPRDTGIPALLDFLRDEHLVGLVCTPHLARGIVQGLGDDEILPDLACVVTLGEAIHGRDVRSILQHLGPDAVYVNEVGASEINCIATYSVRQGDSVPDGNMPAGQVFARKAVRLLGDDGTEVAPGETGELVVVSDFLSGGYWRNDELTAAKFGVDDDGHEFVRQGDLARIDEHGVLQLLGRGDSSVKVRGYLVEPSEIEGALLSQDDIAEAVVIAAVRTPLPTQLIAYVVPKQGVRAPSNPAIRRALRAVLPEYMVPSEILQLTELPRTERGKVDRQALPDVPPRVIDPDALEQRELAMSTLWQQVLELPELQPEDDFMALGGDSLSAEELITQVKEHFGVEVPSADILAYPTLREFTAHVVSGGADKITPSDVVTFNGEAAGTPYFVFAGAGALAFTYLPLAKHLAGNPVFAFQQHGLERRTLPDRTIEAAAARHIAAIRSKRPHGPYRLMGHSFGGLVAFEAAQQLTAAGEEVESLVILDTYLPRSAALGGAADESDAGTITRAPSLVARVLPDGLPDRAHVGRQVRARLAGIWRHSGQRQYDAFYDLAQLMIRRYVIHPYAGRVALVIADENPDGAAAWDHLLTGERVDVMMTAEHTSILREPHVATLAERLRPFLERDRPADA